MYRARRWRERDDSFIEKVRIEVEFALHQHEAEAELFLFVTLRPPLRSPERDLLIAGSLHDVAEASIVGRRN